MSACRSIRLAICSSRQLKVSQVTPALRNSELNHDWLEGLLGQDSNAIAHHLVRSGDKPDDHRVVLTASTAELQEFVLNHFKTEDAWKDSFELKRPTAYFLLLILIGVLVSGCASARSGWDRPTQECRAVREASSTKWLDYTLDALSIADWLQEGFLGGQPRSAPFLIT